MSDPSLRGSELHRKDLTAVDWLKPEDLAGADLTNADLPPNFRFDALGQVEEISKNARKVFIGLLLGCVYAWLTIATTTDVALVVNTATSELPIIGTPVPIVGFYSGASLILAAVYIYFHFYLLRLWRALASLPARFPDGRALDNAAYPWLLIGMVRMHFDHLRSEARPLAALETLVSVFLAWWVVPLTLLGLWLRFLPRHDWLGTVWLVLLITITAAQGILTYRLKEDHPSR